MYETMRPLSFGETLDGAFTLLRRNFSAFFGVALLPQIPVILFWLLLPAVMGPADDAAPVLGAAPMLLAPYSLLVSFLVMGALTHAAGVAYGGERPRIKTSLGQGLRRFLPIAAVTVIAWVLIGLGLLLLIVPGLLLMAMYFAVYAAVMIEGRGPLNALGRSRRLSRGARARILGVLIVAFLIAYLPIMAMVMFMGVSVGVTAAVSAASVAGTSVWLVALMQACSVIVAAVTTPFLILVSVLLYYDRRARTEAPDLESAVAALQDNAV
ncbi:MAG: hypothetical protein ACRELT_14080 [Longimicrobiales bacterium]